MNEPDLKQKILDLVAKYASLFHSGHPFVPGESRIQVSGRVYGTEEMQFLVESALDFWLTAGRFNNAFEKRLAAYVGSPNMLTVNSGSSANLLAVAALCSESLGDRALRPGDEVITSAAAFPTTVNPLLFYGLTPVFVDIDIPAYNVPSALIERAVSRKTRAIMLAHTLGNPFDAVRISEIAHRHSMWLVEDCCDALGTTLNARMAGSFGDIGTLSFYPAHHITTGEGGAIFTRSSQLKRIIESLRGWGRDCWCSPGTDNACGNRYGGSFGSLPPGYDHRYVYSHAGFNLKMTEMQAAVGLAQMDKLPSFVEIRKKNFKALRERLSHLQDFLILPMSAPDSDPSWFGFPITLSDRVTFLREELLAYLNERRIDTRLLFSGNITRQPYFHGRTYRISGELRNTDRVMERTFWIGIYPGLKEEMLDYMSECMTRFLRTKG